MPTDPHCNEVEAHLVEALLARAEAEPADLEHAETCPACGPSLHELASLRAGLEAWSADAASPELAASTRRAVAERRPSTLAAPVPELPAGFGRELARLLGAALAPLPLVLLWNVSLVLLGGRVLGAVLPEALISVLGVGYVVAAAGWLALVYGSLPILAHQRAQRRSGLQEASS
jgi:hypothetical protein